MGSSPQQNPWAQGGARHRDWSKPGGGKQFWHLHPNKFFQSMNEEELAQWQHDQYVMEMILLCVIVAPLAIGAAAGGTAAAATSGAASAGAEVALQTTVAATSTTAVASSTAAVATSTAAGSAVAAGAAASVAISSLQENPNAKVPEAMESFSKGGIEGLNQFFHQTAPYNSNAVYGPSTGTPSGEPNDRIEQSEMHPATQVVNNLYEKMKEDPSLVQTMKRTISNPGSMSASEAAKILESTPAVMNKFEAMMEPASINRWDQEVRQPKSVQNQINRPEDEQPQKKDWDFLRKCHLTQRGAYFGNPDTLIDADTGNCTLMSKFIMLRLGGVLKIEAYASELELPMTSTDVAALLYNYPDQTVISTKEVDDFFIKNPGVKYDLSVPLDSRNPVIDKANDVKIPITREIILNSFYEEKIIHTYYPKPGKENVVDLKKEDMQELFFVKGESLTYNSEGGEQIIKGEGYYALSPIPDGNNAQQVFTLTNPQGDPSKPETLGIQPLPKKMVYAGGGKKTTWIFQPEFDSRLDGAYDYSSLTKIKTGIGNDVVLKNLDVLKSKGFINDNIDVSKLRFKSVNRSEWYSLKPGKPYLLRYSGTMVNNNNAPGGHDLVIYIDSIDQKGNYMIQYYDAILKTVWPSRKIDLRIFEPDSISGDETNIHLIEVYELEGN